MSASLNIQPASGQDFVLMVVLEVVNRNLVPNALALAGGIALLLTMLQTLFGRKGPGDSEVFESLLTRIHQLRQSQFPARYRRLSAIEARVKLLAEAREGLEKTSFFGKRSPT